MIDPVRNLISIEVASGYDDSATEIDVDTGAGALLPDPATDGAFNLVWYNSSDYPNPADDPNVEIIRVTDIDTDTLTISRAQESTSASVKNLGGKVYKLILAPTKKMIDDLYNLTQLQTQELSSAMPMNGTTTPIPIAIQSGGDFLIADANGGAGVQKFHGFVTELLAGAVPSYLYKNEGTGSTVSLTIPAGEDVLLMVCAAEYGSGSLPSNYEFNGQNMIAGISQWSDSATGKYWYLHLGTLASPLTADLVRTGGSLENQVALAYDKVDSASPIQDDTGAINGADPSVTASGLTRFVSFSGGGGPTSISNSGATQRASSGSSGVKDISDFLAVGTTSVLFNGAAAVWCIGVSLRTSTTLVLPTADVKVGGILDGFSGLTPGSTYYLSDTEGVISATPGSNTVRVGYALTATKLRIAP